MCPFRVHPRRAVLAAASALPWFSSSQAGAQEGATVRLPDIVIDRQLPAPSLPSPFAAAGGGSGKRDLKDHPAGEVATTLDRTLIEDTPAQSVADVLGASPGVTVKQGNGPRDIVISIRGNNDRTTAGIRNTQVFEDGFPVTQPDGFSRFDPTDPHAYASIDVLRGPQSALYGNFASGGAILFHTVPGGAVDGVEYGFDGGSYGYLSNWARFGTRSGPFEASLFVSDARSQGFLTQNRSDTQTINFLGTYTPTPDNRVVLKVVNNQLFDEQPIRQSLNQFHQNPLQRGCLTAANAAPGCATFNVFANGSNGATVPVTAQQANLQRDDRRTIIGVRYEHDFDASTTGRAQFTYDDRAPFQPILNPVVTGNYPSFNVYGDLTKRGEVAGLPVATYAGFLFDTLPYNNPNYFLTPNGGLGALNAVQAATQSNVGGRLRAEVNVAPHWFGIIGASIENTTIRGSNLTYATSASGASSIMPANANRGFLNGAPELSLAYRPDDAWQFRGRVATGYTTPSAGTLFVTPQGTPGNNTQLKTQRNLGFDIGADWSPLPNVTLSTTGFNEFFRNELVTQSPGAGLLSYTFNAPASEHRGIEVLARATLPSGVNGFIAYTFDNQIYTDYVEQLSAGALTTRISRNGNRIPGVPENALTLRVGYDQPSGPCKGLGVFVENVLQSPVYLDNANLVTAAAFDIVNANLHYDTAIASSAIKRLNLYFEVRNIADRRYVGSYSIVADSISAATGRQNGAATVAAATGSIYAGAPRSFFGGLRVAF